MRRKNVKDLFKQAQELVDSLTPEQKRDLKKAYLGQKRINPNLDKDVEDLTKDVQDGLKHKDSHEL